MSPIHILHAYDHLSNAPYTAATASVEAELIEVPMSAEAQLDHQLRILTLERWWQIRNAQYVDQKQRQQRRGPSSSCRQLETSTCYAGVLGQLDEWHNLYNH